MSYRSIQQPLLLEVATQLVALFINFVRRNHDMLSVSVFALHIDEL